MKTSTPGRIAMAYYQLFICFCRLVTSKVCILSLSVVSLCCWQAKLLFRLVREAIRQSKKSILPPPVPVQPPQLEQPPCSSSRFVNNYDQASRLQLTVERESKATFQTNGEATGYSCAQAHCRLGVCFLENFCFWYRILRNWLELGSTNCIKILAATMFRC